MDSAAPRRDTVAIGRLLCSRTDYRQKATSVSIGPDEARNNRAFPQTLVGRCAGESYAAAAAHMASHPIGGGADRYETFSSPFRDKDLSILRRVREVLKQGKPPDPLVHAMATVRKVWRWGGSSKVSSRAALGSPERRNAGQTAIIFAPLTPSRFHTIAAADFNRFALRLRRTKRVDICRTAEEPVNLCRPRRQCSLRPSVTPKQPALL